jgi:hypothetical protein
MERRMILTRPIRGQVETAGDRRFSRLRRNRQKAISNFHVDLFSKKSGPISQKSAGCAQMGSTFSSGEGKIGHPICNFCTKRCELGSTSPGPNTRELPFCFLIFK